MWLALTNLLVEPRCRAKYGMDEFRREKLLGLKRHLNELLFDQVGRACAIGVHQLRCVLQREELWRAVRLLEHPKGLLCDRLCV